MAQILAQTQAPVGFDEYAYGIRSRDGAIYHCGRSRPYAGRPLGSESTVGVTLVIPPVDEARLVDCQQLERNWPPLRLGQYQVRQEASRTGTVSFSVDGHEQGVAFANTYVAKYYPAVSTFGGASATVNVGPIFRFAPARSPARMPDRRVRVRARVRARAGGLGHPVHGSLLTLWTCGAACPLAPPGRYRGRERGQT